MLKNIVRNKFQNQKWNKTEHLILQSQRNLPIPRRTFLQEATTTCSYNGKQSRGKITAKNSVAELRKDKQRIRRSPFLTHAFFDSRAA